MKPLFVLIVVFAVCVVGTRIFTQPIDYGLSGKIALAVMLTFTALGHVLYTKGMAMMLPSFVPLRIGLIYLTGMIEILAAIALFIPTLRYTAGILLMVFFVLILPCNIYAAIKQLDYETGTFDGKGISYLWFRIPFQLLLILWTYFFVVN